MRNPKTTNYKDVNAGADSDLSFTTVNLALGDLMYETPVLVCHPRQLGIAEDIKRSLDGAIRTRATPEVGEDEWYVEWQHRRVGSRGA